MQNAWVSWSQTFLCLLEDRETPAKPNAFGSYRRAAYKIAARYIILKHITTILDKFGFCLFILKCWSHIL